MQRLARQSATRPALALAGWLLAVAVLAVLGLGVEERLTQSVLVIPGTESERAVELARQEFGESVTIPILLEGPRKALERQGPALARELSRRADTRVLTPWDRARGADRLRPSPGAAMIVASVDRPLEEAFDELGPEIRELTEDAIEAPVEARVTGQAAIGADLKEESYSAARSAERIALPVLLVVLLLVFRTPVAAAIPAGAGIATVGSGFGAIWLLAGVLEIDPIATSLVSMMGLALGVDYSLLMVSRFREELGRGADSRSAAITASATAGRTVLFAGAALLVAMAVAMVVSPGDLLLSAAVGVSVATVIAMLTAFVAMPASLALLGRRIDRWRLGPAPGQTPSWLAAVRGALAKPGVAAVLVLVPLLVLSAPALGLDTGPPDVGQLPEGTEAREDFERVSEVMGPGWAAPFDVVLVSDDGTITKPRRLREISAWQSRLSELDAVSSVVGPGRLTQEAKTAQRAERQIGRGRRGLERLAAGVRQAEQGVREIQSGLGEASRGASELAEGSGEAESGAEEIAGQLGAAAGGAELIRGAVREARAGSRELIRRLDQAAGGAGELVDGLAQLAEGVQAELVPGAEQLADGLREGSGDIERLREPVGVAERELQRALDELEAMTVGKADPRYPTTLEAVARASGAVTGRDPITGTQLDPSYQGLDAALAEGAAQLLEAANAADRLAAGGRELAEALAEIRAGAARLRDGLDELSKGGDELIEGLTVIEGALRGLRDGLHRLQAGAAELAGGLDRLEGGSGELATGLGSADRQVEPLISGLGDAAGGAERLSGELGEARSRQQRESPGLFDSGYFVLAGVDGARRRQREQAQFAVNVEGGGEAGRILIVPESGPNSEATSALQDRLDRRVQKLGFEIDAAAAVGGPAAQLAEYDEVTSERLLYLILALALVSYLVLVPVFRSLLLPALAVLLNLLSVAVAFGALALLFQGSDPILGGPGYVDAVSISAIYTVIFGLSLDYQVFLITRMREGWDSGQGTDEAIAHGLEKTASVVTGAAAIMIGVFAAFAFTEVANTRQFGVGLAIAVLVDATIVRLVLLPATMSLLGDACWKLPAWLDRRLPRLDVEG